MRLKDAFPSKNLSAKDLDEDVTYTISGYTFDAFNEGEAAKIRLEFEETEQGFVVNKTNGTTIEKVLGTDDIDKWVGKRITIYPTEVEFKGETVLGLRVRLRAPKAKAASANAPAEFSSGQMTNEAGTITAAQLSRLEKTPGSLAAADLKYGDVAELTDLSKRQASDLIDDLS